MTQDSKQKLEQAVWRNKNYYHLAHKASLDINHPGMKLLIKQASKAINILDMGCGEGTRLGLITDGEKNAVGIDLSKTAIQMAAKNFPKLNFTKADLKKIPFVDQSFDLVYSAYVLEHLDKVEKVLLEAKRVLQIEGTLVLIAPNYGSPNRASPPFTGSRIKKLIKGFMADLIRPFWPKKSLSWCKVEPIATYHKYEVDYDTTIEPYLGSLLPFLELNGFKIEQALSCWSQELEKVKIHQRLFKFLGKFGIYPFWMWGPHLVVVAKK